MNQAIPTNYYGDLTKDDRIAVEFEYKDTSGGFFANCGIIDGQIPKTLEVYGAELEFVERADRDYGGGSFYEYAIYRVIKKPPNNLVFLNTSKGTNR